MPTNISAEYSQTEQKLKKRIESWKRELLDTSRRNRMINYRETKRSTLQILEPDAFTLFHKLTHSEKALSFQKPIDKSTNFRTFAIVSLMETLSYHLDVKTGDLKTSGTATECNTTLRNLRAKAKLAREEQGTNILYLCFGFVYWRDQRRSGNTWMKAPLLLMPVSLELKTINSPFSLRRADDDIEVNPTLNYLLKTEYQFEFPPFEPKTKESFRDYLTAASEIAEQHGWQVVPEVSLGLLSFLKISMYHDLEMHQEQIFSHPVLRAMAGDGSALKPLPAADEQLHPDRVNPEQLHEVVDADSSQEEAILLSKQGYSFVMQGPPGTGKSQTITNIIAEGLAAGKKILFVSEKAAALQVVLKRLKEVHLDDFCLSLHSNKANKKEIVDDIGKNLNLAGIPPFKSMDADSDELYQMRNILNGYAEQLHTPISPLMMSFYDVCGRLSVVQNASVVPFRIEAIGDTTPSRFSAMQYQTAQLEKALHQMRCSPIQNPWNGTDCRSAGLSFRTAFSEKTAGLSAQLRSALACSHTICSELGIQTCETADEINKLNVIAAVLQTSPAYMNPIWFQQETQQNAEHLFAEAYEHYECFIQHKEAIDAEWSESVLELDLNSLNSILNDIPANKTELTVDRILLNQQTECEQLLARTEQLLSDYHALSDLLHYQLNDSIGSIQTMVRIGEYVASAPDLESVWLDYRKRNELKNLMPEARQTGLELNSLMQQFIPNWETGILETDTDAMLRRFKLEYIGLFRKMKSQYKADMMLLRMHWKNSPKELKESDIQSHLELICRIREKKSWFREKSPAFQALLGQRYCGAETNWDAVSSSLEYAEQLAGLFPFSSVPEAAARSLCELRRSLPQFQALQGLLMKLSVSVTETYLSDLANSRLAPERAKDTDLKIIFIPKLKYSLEIKQLQIQRVHELCACKRNGQVHLPDAYAVLTHSEEFRAEQQWFLAQQTLFRTVFGRSLRLKSEKWAELQAGICAAGRIICLFPQGVPEEVVRLCCKHSGISQEFSEARSLLSELLEASSDKLAYYFSLFSGTPLRNQSVAVVADRYDACLSDFEALEHWIEFTEAKEECDRLGLNEFTSYISEIQTKIPDPLNAFLRGFYSQWLEFQTAQLPSLRTFRRRSHEQQIHRFVLLDCAQIRAARYEIRNTVTAAFPNRNQISKGQSELSILLHEMNKRMRIIPLRKLFQSIPNLLLTLKPCLMMSPLSVSYFLDADLYRFDMVIFDEASQVFPQDAIGSIFRADQVIIAGDTKQLPPTSFFASGSMGGAEEYDSDDPETEQDILYDSILEETASILPSKTLLWHYRSRHEHLIAFSNQHIYRNELITFPGISETAPYSGVQFIYVPEGYYEGGGKNCNKLEALKCVALIDEHIQRHPDRSLGIIAFSEKQQQAILSEVQKYREKHPQCESFFAEEKDEEFFVKNLENVQGDERDTIIFSIGYAKTRQQKEQNRPMAMRFGPLGLQGGERRLNVAITRAKLNVMIVSSILPTDLDLSRTSSEGVKMLRAYMEFAQKGASELTGTTPRANKDQFVESVAEVLRENGYTVRQNIGCSDNRIDIAVIDNTGSTERYAVGVMCDGYTYASFHTARDRNRLQPSVMKSIGWNLYRVWSAEWFRDPETEKQKLLQYVRAAMP